MEGLDLGQTSNPSLAWKKGRFQNDDDDDELYRFNLALTQQSVSELIFYLFCISLL